MGRHQQTSFPIVLFLLLRIVFIGLIVLVPFIMSPANNAPSLWYVAMSITVGLLGLTMLRFHQQLANHFKARSTKRGWFPAGFAIQYDPRYFCFFGVLFLAISLALLLMPLWR